MSKVNCKMNPQGNRYPCSKKATFVGLAKYKSEAGESDVEVAMCEECAKRVKNRLYGQLGNGATGLLRVKVGVLEIWSVQPMAHIASARQPKVK